MPKTDEIYIDRHAFKVIETTKLSGMLEGEHRPEHFAGMLTVVLKLLILSRPTNLYLGEKDYQQYLLVKGMAEAFFLDIEVVVLPTVRDINGLALSSRNKFLSETQLQKAPLFFQLLSSANLPDKGITSRLIKEGFAVDYIKTYENRRFGAVTIGGVRLIDNFQIYKGAKQ